MKKGSNEWWTQLSAAFDAHVRSEAHSIEEYERLHDVLDDPGTRFLLNLILEDERRHHALFERLASAARNEGDAPPEPQLDADAVAQLAEPTRRYLADEREDRHHLERLRRELGGRHAGLWSLLIELLDLDTQKHVRILEYLDACVTEAATPPKRGR